MVEKLMTKPTVTLPDGKTLVRHDHTTELGDLAIIHNGTYSRLTTMHDPAVIAYSPLGYTSVICSQVNSTDTAPSSSPTACTPYS